MKMKIKQLATVQMGYSFRSRLETLSDGNVAIIQMKDLRHNNVVDCRSFVNISMAVTKKHHLSKKGDLVFRSRGQLTTAAILLDDPGRAVVAAPLLRIRVKDSGEILPEYLNWYINQRDAQRYLKSRQEGTSVNMVSRKQLMDLPVDVPSVKIQKSIVELAKLAARERVIMNILAEKKEQYISMTLVNFAQGGTTDGHR